MARLKSVLLVDFDNIFAATGIAMVDTLPKWLLWLSDGALSVKGRRRKFAAKRVYWNSQYDVHREAFEAAGFEAFDCRAHAKSKIASGKSSADIVMTMDAIELRHQLNGVDEFIVLTTDSDFVPVVKPAATGRPACGDGWQGNGPDLPALFRTCRRCDPYWRAESGIRL